MTTPIAHRISVVFALAVFTLLALPAPPAAATSWPAEGRRVRLDVAGGTLEVSVVPDRGYPLQLSPTGDRRWRFTGSTADLVGQPYSVVLRNQTGERLKVVVGVDGLNVYEREEVAGRSDADVGSILAPWSDRTLPGWQVGHHRAQRFVFSPPEWSEGEGRTDRQIGLLTVQVYREWEPPYYERGARDGAVAPGSAGAPPAEPSARRERQEEQEGGSSPRVQSARPPIGTTAGEDVDSQVRTVRFVAASLDPEAWATIDYGNARHARRLPREEPWHEHDDYGAGLGLGVADDRYDGGTRVVSVRPGSPADRAGLEPHDVIVRIDTVTLPSADTTRRILRDKGPGEYAFLRVRRGEHELAFKLRTS
jgi:hypothetical protein